ncbi:hypothetical protein WOLCODRAFT_164050 [Wolfiporia cocos MD-104 SS10]|uniref:Protein kinase domain-containing protein n=1 Tax=Wolfiporia cocos (strain MD-104) TaxID=742152 RepID=A0A2H3JKV2_WOLCO|nr:hypothetical protein WOLCODRAFT_164050 [Wolfiporia cocos MD-104 SS10]
MDPTSLQTKRPEVSSQFPGVSENSSEGRYSSPPVSNTRSLPTTLPSFHKATPYVMPQSGPIPSHGTSASVYQHSQKYAAHDLAPSGMDRSFSLPDSRSECQDSSRRQARIMSTSTSRQPTPRDGLLAESPAFQSHDSSAADVSMNWIQDPQLQRHAETYIRLDDGASSRRLPSPPQQLSASRVTSSAPGGDHIPAMTSPTLKAPIAQDMTYSGVTQPQGQYIQSVIPLDHRKADATGRATPGQPHAPESIQRSSSYHQTFTEVETDNSLTLGSGPTSITPPPLVVPSSSRQIVATGEGRIIDSPQPLYQPAQMRLNELRQEVRTLPLQVTHSSEGLVAQSKSNVPQQLAFGGGENAEQAPGIAARSSEEHSRMIGSASEGDTVSKGAQSRIAESKAFPKPSPPMKSQAMRSNTVEGLTDVLPSDWKPYLLERRPWHYDSSNSTLLLPNVRLQAEGWIRTHQAICTALGLMSEYIGPAAHDVLRVGAALSSLIPVPGLHEAANALLEIWNALQEVEDNRCACLGLTERSAIIFRSIRQQIAQSAEQVKQDLVQPIQSLIQVYHEVTSFFHEQRAMLRITRLLKRHYLKQMISKLDKKLGDAVALFGAMTQVQIVRDLKGLQHQLNIVHAQLAENTVKNDEDPSSRTLAIHAHSVLPLSVPPTPPQPENQTSPRAQISELLNGQISDEMIHDDADMEHLMHTALKHHRDIDVVNFLQIAPDEMPEAIVAFQNFLHRQQDPNDQSHTDKIARGDSDTVGRKFIEVGISAMQRLSANRVPAPHSVITWKDILLEEQIGCGPQSIVYRGTWNNRTVAVKILAQSVQWIQFKREVVMWRPLQHPRILELLGTSSTLDAYPWFFVSPYIENGTLPSYLQFQKSSVHGTLKAYIKMLTMMREIAEGMQYLHARDIVHGDLKGANVFITDDGHCILADFGQSQNANDGNQVNHSEIDQGGTLQWQAPELLRSKDSQITKETDIYAFAMCCLEILNWGGTPWENESPTSDQLRDWVLNRRRPTIRSPFPVSQTVEIIKLCWQEFPEERPDFTDCIMAVNAEIAGFRDDSTTTVSVTGERKEAQAVLAPMNSSSTLGSTLVDDGSRVNVYREYLTTGSKDPDARAESLYRAILSHEFNATLDLPLWSPSPIACGAVGYYLQGKGTFAHLFNVLSPTGYPWNLTAIKTPDFKMRLVLNAASQRSRVWGPLYRIMPRGRKIHRQLHQGKAAAFLFAETTRYQNIHPNSIDQLSKWLQENADSIIDVYASNTPVTRDNLCIVTGTLDAENYALFVSDEHSNGHVEFTVPPNLRPGDKWGAFSVTTTQPSRRAALDPITAEKVSDFSSQRGQWDTVLMAAIYVK